MRCLERRKRIRGWLIVLLLSAGCSGAAMATLDMPVAPEVAPALRGLPGAAPDALPAGAEKPGFAEVIATSEERSNYEHGRMLAIAMLSGGEGLDAQSSAITKAIAQGLARARVHVSTSVDSERQCTEKNYSMFVHLRYPDIIFVCAITRRHVQKLSPDVYNILAQGFIHEGAHLIGVSDECEATLIELMVVSRSGGRPGYGNFRRYASQCAGLLDGYAPGAAATRSHQGRVPSVRASAEIIQPTMAMP